MLTVALPLQHAGRRIFPLLTKTRFGGADPQHLPLAPAAEGFALPSHPLPAARNSQAGLAPQALSIGRGTSQPLCPSPPVPHLFPTFLPPLSLPQSGVFLRLPSSTSWLPTLLPPPVCLLTPCPVTAEPGTEFHEPGRCNTTRAGAAVTLLHSSGQPKESQKRETKSPTPCAVLGSPGRGRLTASLPRACSAGFQLPLNRRITAGHSTW